MTNVVCVTQEGRNCFTMRKTIISDFWSQSTLTHTGYNRKGKKKLGKTYKKLDGVGPVDDRPLNY